MLVEMSTMLMMVGRDPDHDLLGTPGKPALPCGEHSRQAECSTRAGDRGLKDTICETRLFQQLGEILPREMGPGLSGSSGWKWTLLNVQHRAFGIFGQVHNSEGSQYWFEFSPSPCMIFYRWIQMVFGEFG